MKTRHIVLAIGFVIAASFAFFGDKTPNSGVAEAVVRSPALKLAAKPLAKKLPESASVFIDSLRPRTKPVAGEQMGGEAKSSGEPLFGSQNWNPPPPPVPVIVVPPQAPPAPTAPPLPFIFLGKSLSEGKWEVFLGRGERTIVVQNKSVIDGTYRVDAIVPPLLTLTYLPLNQVQQLTIGVLD